MSHHYSNHTKLTPAAIELAQIRSSAFAQINWTCIFLSENLKKKGNMEKEKKGKRDCPINAETMLSNSQVMTMHEWLSDRCRSLSHTSLFCSLWFIFSDAQKCNPFHFLFSDTARIPLSLWGLCRFYLFILTVSLEF
jgi:hypothetical protein